MDWIMPKTVDMTQATVVELELVASSQRKVRNASNAGYQERKRGATLPSLFLTITHY